MRWLLLLLCATFDLRAQSAEALLVPWNALWRYSILDGEPGADWNDPDFDDTAWLEGRAPLGFPINIPTEPLCGDLPLDELGASGTRFPESPNPAQITTYYRTRFTFGGDPSQTTLILSNLCEDGCVAYLNGQEIVRIRMPSGPIAFTTPASARASMSDIVRRWGDRVGLDGNTLRTGENVLAVELHQNSTTSGTLYQMTSLLAVPGSGPVNAEPSLPADATVLQGRGLLLKSSFLGSLPLTYQWFFDPGSGEVPIPQATNASYSIQDMTIAQAGAYFVRVTGFQGSVESRRAMVTFQGDLDPPRLIFARWLDDESILVRFDEPIDVSPTTGALDPFAYRIQPDSEPAWSVGSVMATEQNTGLILSAFTVDTQPVRRQGGFRHEVQIYAGYIADSFGNRVDHDIRAEIFSPIVLLPLDAYWHYNQAGTDLGADWFLPPVDTSGSAWHSGQGVLAEETAGPVVPLIRTDLQAPSEGGPNTHYFVTRFEVPAEVGTIFAADLMYYVDDFAIVYLNGREVSRVGVPPCAGAVGPIGLLGLAGVAPLTGLVLGENELAVELHQAGAYSSDVVWGGELAVFAPIIDRFEPRIFTQPADVSAPEGGTAVFAVTAFGQPPLAYQWQHNGLDLEGQTDPTLVIHAVHEADAGLYRARVTNFNGTTESRNARLTVLPVDPPTPSLAVRALGNGDVELSWSAGPDWILVQSPTPEGDYAPVAEAGPPSPWTLTPAPGQTMFYRLKWAP